MDTTHDNRGDAENAAGEHARQGAGGLAVMLRVRGWSCVVVGGGAVALRRARGLAAAGAEVVVIAPRVDKELTQYAARIEARAYRAGDLTGARLVVIATDRPAVNAAVAAEATAAGVLVNRTDAAERGDFTVMGQFRRGPVTVGVDTGGSSAAAGKAIREELDAALDKEWAVLLEEARPWRKRVQENDADSTTRTTRLRRLTDSRARAVLREQGVEALRDYLRNVAELCADK